MRKPATRLASTTPSTPLPAASTRPARARAIRRREIQHRRRAAVGASDDDAEPEPDDPEA